MNQSDKDTWERYGCSPEIRAAAIAAAQLDGLDVIHPTPRQLFLDIDGPAAMIQYQNTLNRLGNNLGAKESARWPSKTEGHFHVIVGLDRDLPAELRLVLQACLGSDPIREFLAVGLMLQGVEEPSVLFRPPNLSSGSFVPEEK